MRLGGTPTSHPAQDALWPDRNGGKVTTVAELCDTACHRSQRPDHADWPGVSRRSLESTAAHTAGRAVTDSVVRTCGRQFELCLPVVLRSASFVPM